MESKEETQWAAVLLGSDPGETAANPAPEEDENITTEHPEPDHA
jgi:hypothetical protein